MIQIPGLVNVDFADVRAIMANAGSSLMGIGTATGNTIKFFLVSRIFNICLIPKKKNYVFEGLDSQFPLLLTVDFMLLLQ